MSAKFSGCLAASLLVALAMVPKVQAIKIDVSEDANVYKLKPDVNNTQIGDTTQIIARRRPDPNWQKPRGYSGPPPFDDVTIGFFKFDLSPIPDNVAIGAMSLNLAYKDCQYTAPFDLEVYHVADDNWQEGTITWNNKPAFSFAPEYPEDADAIAALLVNPPVNTGTIYSIDLLAFGLYNPTQDLIDDTLTLAINIPNPPGGIGFYSREGQSVLNPSAQLNITPVPEPLSIGLLCFGLIGIVGVNKRQS